MITNKHQLNLKATVDSIIVRECDFKKTLQFSLSAGIIVTGMIANIHQLSMTNFEGTDDVMTLRHVTFKHHLNFFSTEAMMITKLDQ